MTPNWQTYKVERRDHGLRRYRARSTYVEINGVPTEQHYTFTRRGAEEWIARLRERQNAWSSTGYGVMGGAGDDPDVPPWPHQGRA